MRALVPILVVLGACRTEAPAPNDVAVAADSRSVPVIESPPVPSASAPPVVAAPSSSAGLPARADAIPAAWLTCASDADCAAIKSACCGSWPANQASRDRVREAVAAADRARNFCRNRMCIQKVDMPACDHGKCVIH